MNILAIIPARGGSKGIPKKNIRLMNGKPLISYAINNALNSKYVTDVFVSTDSQEIADVAEICGAHVIFRDNDLASDAVTLDPVIYDAMQKVSQIMGKAYDIVITLQPTSPLLTVDTLDRAIEYFVNGNYDTVISVVNHPHLSWGKKDGKIIPNYMERKNRQQLPAEYYETGAFLIAKSNIITVSTRIGEKVSVFEVPSNESVDIDDVGDWVVAENILQRKKIIFRVDGYVKLGLGHIYNCITLAFSMIGHDVLLLLNSKSLEGIKKVQETNLPFRVFENDNELEAIIRDERPDIWVNDCLGTDESYINYLKSKVERVITIEDLGTGIQKADAVINALYDDVHSDNIYSGWKYVCLRDEFQIEKPAPFSKEVKNILVMFGGTDPSNLNARLYNIAKEIVKLYPQIRFTFLIGIGYDNENHGVVSNEQENIYVYPNVSRVTKYMKNADLAITSQGRTIFELAAMAIPSIVLSQNEREMTHTFAQLDHGFVNLGLGSSITDGVIENTIKWLIDTSGVRENMYELMLEKDLRSGLQRVKKIILGE